MSAFPFSIVGFDLDGTLVDTADDLGAALNHALQGDGRPPVPPGEMRALIGGGPRRMLARALALTGGADAATAARLYGELIADYRANIAVHSRPYPGALSVLDELAALGVRLAVVTNKRFDLACELLDALAMKSRFDCVIGAEMGRNLAPKPDSAMICAMIADCGGGAAAFVGDSAFDVQAARNAGIASAVVRFGYAAGPPERLGADMLIDSYDRLIDTLVRFSRDPIQPA